MSYMNIIFKSTTKECIQINKNTNIISVSVCVLFTIACK